MFSIKLKTRNGNLVKQKQTLTVFFKLKFKQSALTKQVIAEYTYRILYKNGGVKDTGVVYKMKTEVKSIEHMTLRVMLNCIHVIGKMTKSLDLNPDFILFISTDYDSKKNKAWKFLNHCFDHDKRSEDFKANWDNELCNNFKIERNELLLLRDFVDLNPNVKFMNIDPNYDKSKYHKSIAICNALNDRLDRQLQLIPTI